jgi:hypothetical protein
MWSRRGRESVEEKIAAMGICEHLINEKTFERRYQRHREENHNLRI